MIHTQPIIAALRIKATSYHSKSMHLTTVILLAITITPNINEIKLFSVTHSFEPVNQVCNLYLDQSSNYSSKCASYLVMSTSNIQHKLINDLFLKVKLYIIPPLPNTFCHLQVKQKSRSTPEIHYRTNICRSLKSLPSSNR